MKREEIKPCPFCGSNDIKKRMDKYTDGNFYTSFICRECKAEALENVWGKRADRARLLAEVDKDTDTTISRGLTCQR